MSEKSTIKISIAGRCGVGKSAAMFEIEKLLKDKGFDVSFSKPEEVQSEKNLGVRSLDELNPHRVQFQLEELQVYANSFKQNGFNGLSSADLSKEPI